MTTHDDASAHRRPPLAISLAALTSSVDRFGISPLLMFIAVDFGVSLAGSVAVASVYFLCYGLSQPVWGILSDALGRLPVMRIALIGSVLGSLASLLAPELLSLTLARAVTGAFFGAVVPASITYVGDTSTPRHRQSALSDLMAAIAVGTALATAAAGLVGQWLDWRVMFAVSAGLALLSLIPLFRLPEPERETGVSILRGMSLFFRERWALLVVGLAFVEGALVLGLLTLLAPALEHQGVSPGAAGLSVAAYGVATILVSRGVRPLTARWSSARIIALGGTCLTLGLGIVALHQSVPTVIVAALLLGATWALMHTSLQAWVTEVVPSARGLSVAFFAGCLFAGSAAGSGLAGPLAEAGHWGLLFGVAAVVALALTVVAAATRSRYQYG
ncbi:MFS transporter [Citricoccus sp. NR2]|uniref:MFS transporter n=1 Tax=Citricoccus sp. NR2 TaxID=3004095 RepID=UPI0022DE4370|nr:MFS transporter [Citricoccus sp. NR2]WBL20117.1 MFS transporter [Citricoccus sp. NR2]